MRDLMEFVVYSYFADIISNYFVDLELNFFITVSMEMDDETKLLRIRRR